MASRHDDLFGFMALDDPIECALADLATRCTAAWHGKPSECAQCPLAEVAAMTAAVLEFYRLSKEQR